MTTPKPRRHRAPKAPVPYEIDVQASIISAIRMFMPTGDVRAVPNASGWLSKAQRGKLAKEGRTKGTLDLIVAWPGLPGAKGGSGFIEVKRPGYTASDVTPEQRDLIETWGGWGLNTGIASSPEEAIALLRAWGAPLLSGTIYPNGGIAVDRANANVRSRPSLTGVVQ